MHLVSIVLSGGAGTRLWPVSRQALPKPFMHLGGSSLLQQAIERGQACGAGATTIVTNQDYLFLTRGVLGGLSDPPQVRYLLEPKGRNTAPAIALAALACAQQYGTDAVMLVLPADHLIPDTESFVACALEAARHAQQGQLVVFGVPPTTPETGFGYIEVEKASRNSQKALRFVEKPDLSTAQQYLATGRFYWNSGMFCFSAGTLLQAMKDHAPQVLAAAEHAFGDSTSQDGVTRFDAHAFGLQPDISIDYAVMERATNVTLVPAKFGWSDVGSWPAVAQAHPADTSGNTFVDADGTEFAAVETTGTHVQVESHTPKVVATIGVQDLVIVDTPDALLVAHKNSAQKVKTVVDLLKERKHESTQLPAAVHRPWGTYATLKEESGYKVKRITVKPGQSLSLQYHHQRAEHWVVVQGMAIVQIGEEEHETMPGQYRYIPLKEKHRLTNIGKDELVLIEVQCGAYLGEDDIVRLADVYGRA
ncbi:mannose-1-phosphate guanylyltransferase/mannose-6-phosphate isomerase [Variovorax terrae]|uniref:mannose-1-phosphate guanylyltransferase n=1 Tax=Variovorax terrae TaxID=2923278 RepID=A0A9X1VR73_9BURK|nr:mannose-1-phosphate guanylyltransferase/mannose-6-phosphate isomerase [Variovorax terrae]MCJ0761875.1 mannose-1-phosphate guanylyltransferase/mannose-6-phosphate isomerase [Variovorax terrae]